MKKEKNYRWYGAVIGLIFGIMVVASYFIILEPISSFLSIFNLVSYIQISESMVLFPFGITLFIYTVLGFVVGKILEEI